jgi:hypothetical protein
MTIIAIVISASVAVTQMLPVAVPPRCRPNSDETAGNRQQPEDVHGQHEEEHAPDVLDEAIGVLVQRRLGDFLPDVLAHRLEHVGAAGRHEAVDIAPAAAAADHDRHECDQQHAGERDHRDLIRKNRDHAVRRQRTEIRGALDERMLDDVLERALRVGGRRGMTLGCVLLLHNSLTDPAGPRSIHSAIASFTSSGSSTT